MTTPRSDLEIIDAEPWNLHGPVDKLIDLQHQAFGADRAGDYRQFGQAVMQMSGVEHVIGNHVEAAAYAQEAAEAFVKGGHDEEAVSAHSTLAKEYRTTLSPNLALASLQDVIRLRTQLSAKEAGMEADLMIDGGLQPVMRLVASFMASYTGNITEDKSYPSVYMPKKVRPSKNAVEESMEELNNLLDLPTLMTNKEATSSLMQLGIIYANLKSRRLGLSKAAKKTAEIHSTRLSRLGMWVGSLNDESGIFSFGDISINETIFSQMFRRYKSWR